MTLDDRGMGYFSCDADEEEEEDNNVDVENEQGDKEVDGVRLRNHNRPPGLLRTRLHCFSPKSIQANHKIVIFEEIISSYIILSSSTISLLLKIYDFNTNQYKHLSLRLISTKKK